jgi:hypothetical protein
VATPYHKDKSEEAVMKKNRYESNMATIQDVYESVVIPASEPRSLSLVGKVAGTTGWLSNRMGNYATRRLMNEAASDQYRAFLAQSALTNIAALSALEEQLSRTSPLGEERYRQILDAYAVSAAFRIAEWQ